MRFAKRKGSFGKIEAHHERTKTKYASNPDVDISKSKNNFHIVQPSKSYLQEVNARIALTGCKVRKDSVRFIDTIITASAEFFKGKSREELRSYFQTAVDFLERKIGNANIFSAVVHMDEKTPHLHLCFTPITQDGRLSAKEIIGNRSELIKWQDNFFEHMVSKFPDIERGEPASETKRQHIPTRVFKQAVHLTKQALLIQSTINSITPFNAGKKREEIMALLNKFFPDMENFETQARKHKRTIDRLEKDNELLAKKAEAAGKVGIARQLEEANLRSDLETLRQFVDSLPDELKKQAKVQNINIDKEASL